MLVILSEAKNPCMSLLRLQLQLQLLFLLVIPEGDLLLPLPFLPPSPEKSSSRPKQMDSPPVPCAVEKPALSEAERDPRIALLLLPLSITETLKDPGNKPPLIPRSNNHS